MMIEDDNLSNNARTQSVSKVIILKVWYVCAWRISIVAKWNTFKGYSAGVER